MASSVTGGSGAGRMPTPFRAKSVAAPRAPTTGLAPAASDVVSAMTAAQFGQQGLAYQQLAAQAAEVHEQLVAALRSGASAYGLTEAANVAASQV